MRKLLAGFILAAALPVSATLTEDIQAGNQPVADIITNALAGCGSDAACEEAVLTEAGEAGVDASTIQNIATNAGVPATIITAAATAVETTNNSNANNNSNTNNSNNDSDNSNSNNNKQPAQTVVYQNEDGTFTPPGISPVKTTN